MITSEYKLSKPVGEMSQQEYNEALFLADYVEGITIFEGRKGSGKTTMACAMAHKLRELFNRPVVSDVKFKSDFGTFKYLDEQKFLEIISKVTTIAKNSTQEDVDLGVEWALNKLDIDLHGATIILDEAYKYFDCRTPMDKLVRIFGYFIAQSRHYRCAVFILAPSKKYLDWRVRQQIDATCKVTYNPAIQGIHARFVNHTTGNVKRTKIYAPTYWEYFDSWGPITLRQKLLDVRGL